VISTPNIFRLALRVIPGRDDGSATRRPLRLLSAKITSHDLLKFNNWNNLDNKTVTSGSINIFKGNLERLRQSKEIDLFVGN